MARRNAVGLSVLFVSLLAFAIGGCEAKSGVGVAQAAIASGPSDTTVKADASKSPQGTDVLKELEKKLQPQGSAASAKATEPAKVAAPPTDAASALQSAMDQKKYLFVSFYKPGDQKGEEVRKALAEAEGPLSQKALFYAADVTNPKEQVLVSKYQVNRAPLPLTLAFAENGAIVKAFPGKTVDRGEFEKAFVSPKMAEVQKGFQDKKIMLLCVQGKETQHNAESLGAAREVTKDEKAGNAITIVEAAPEDPANADLMKQLRVDATMREATVFVLVPPGNLAGKIEGSTTKDVLWQAVLKGASSCGSGCGPSGCGPRK